MSLIPKFYKDAVVPIGTRLANGSVLWVGTGFFVTRKVSKDQSVPFLLTNRHVFQDRKSITISMKEYGSDNLKLADASLIKEDGSVLYRAHPNPQIDIVVLELNAQFIIDNKLEFPSFDIDEHALTSEELRGFGVDDGSIVYMLGYTLGLVNKGSNAPLCRMGCIARMSKTQIEQENNILVDIQNFPGNSGSPVIHRPELISISGTRAFEKSVLIGIVHSYIPYSDQLRSSQTGEVVEVRRENSGIANVHPVEYIREIIDTIYSRYISEG